MPAEPSRPVILILASNPTLRRSLAADLRDHCERAFDVRTLDDPATGEDELARLEASDQQLALVILDEALGSETASAVLEAADERFPGAKRALVGGAAFVDEALPTDLRVDCRLETAADRDDRLFPEIDDLLDDWLRVEQPAADPVRVIGRGSEPREHDLRDLLLRNRVSYEWLDLESSGDAASALEDVGLPDGPFPVVLLPDGRAMADPGNAELAEALGARTQPGTGVYDLVIVGAGPAGLAAAVSAASEGLETVLIEAEATGGQAGSSARIENYPGFPGGIRGANLADRMLTQATRFGADVVIPTAACGLEREDGHLAVHLVDGSTARGRAVLLAGGVSYRQLEVPGIDRLHGRGVYYGSGLAEARELHDSDAVVVGGGNSAGQAAVHLARHARAVTLLVRGEQLEEGMSEYLVEQIRDIPNLEVRTSHEVVAVRGRRRLEAVRVENADGVREELPARALYVWIGREPRTDWLPPSIRLDDEGFVLVGLDLLTDENDSESADQRRDLVASPFSTSLEGVFAVGDIRSGAVGRVAQAVGDGAACLPAIHAWLSRH
jgi:thioredoxin reductase (NADPH)